MFTKVELFWYSFVTILILVIITIIAKHNDPQEGMETISNIKTIGDKAITGIKNSASVITKGISKIADGIPFLSSRNTVKARLWQDPGAISMDPDAIDDNFQDEQDLKFQDNQNIDLSCNSEEERNDYVGSRECRGAFYGFAGCGKASRVPNAELAFDAIGELTINRLDPNDLNNITDCNGDTHTNVYSYTEPTGCPYNK